MWDALETQHDSVGVVGAKTVVSPRRVPDHRDPLAGCESRREAPRGGVRVVETLRAREHVRPGRDWDRPHLPEADIGLRRDRRRRRVRETLAEVTYALRDMDDQGPVVGCLQTRHPPCLSTAELLRPFDFDQRARRADTERVLDRADDVLCLDRHTLVRRGIPKARLEAERVSQTVVRDLWQRSRQIRTQNGSSFLGRPGAVVEKRPRQTAAEQFRHRG